MKHHLFLCLGAVIGLLLAWVTFVMLQTADKGEQFPTAADVSKLSLNMTPEEASAVLGEPPAQHIKEGHLFWSWFGPEVSFWEYRTPDDAYLILVFESGTPDRLKEIRSKQRTDGQMHEAVKLTNGIN